MINFVKGEATIKSARHMEIKMYHAKEEFMKGWYDLKHVSGVVLPADVLTKVCTNERFQEFVGEVQGMAYGVDDVSPSSCISAGELGGV
jgi:hypothetical protein